MTDAASDVQETEQDSVLAVSDDEWTRLGPDAFTSDASDDEAEEETEADTSDDVDAEEEDAATEEDDTDSGEAEEDAAAADSEDTSDDVDASDDAEDVDKDNDEEEADDNDVATQHRTFYEQVTKPFRANGREMRIDNPEDVIQLMKMGAGFNKKMAALKPNLKLVKMLEKNKLLDEDKISFLIDINNKRPEAIAKLLKDSDIDPMDLDTDKADDYVSAPQNRISDKEVELDEVLDSIKDTPSYPKTLDIVGNQWDEKSRQLVTENPQVLNVINDHITSGIYDIISKEMERERVLGRLNGLSDIEAYRQVGDAIDAKGGFSHIGNRAKTPTRAKPSPKSKKADDAARRSKKRAVSPPKRTSPAAKDSDFNPLSMSDEEFEKVGLSKFL